MTAQILQLIDEEHAVISRLLRLIEREVEQFRSGGDADLVLLELVLAYMADYPDRFHHPKEDLIFAALKRRHADSAAFVGRLSLEHERVAKLTRDLAALVERLIEDASMARNVFVDAANSYLTFQRVHMAFENEILFPAALAHLEPQDWAELDAELETLADPLSGAGRDAGRFQRLREAILPAA